MLGNSSISPRGVVSRQQPAEAVSRSAWKGSDVAQIQKRGADIQQAHVFRSRLTGRNVAGPRYDEWHAACAVVERALPPHPMFSKHLPVIGAIDDDGVVGESAFREGGEDRAYLPVQKRAQTVVGNACSPLRIERWRGIDSPAPALRLVYRMQVVVGRRKVREDDPVAVGSEVVRGRNERTMRGDIADGKQKRSVVSVATSLAEPTRGCTGDRLVVGMVSRAPRPALDHSRQAHARRIDEVAEHSLQFPAGSRIHRLGHLAYDPLAITVPLVRPPEVHAARKDGVVSGSEERVRERRDVAAELAFVVPETQFVGMAAGHERHAARGAQWVGAVCVAEARSSCSETVQIRGVGNAISGEPHDPRVVLVAHDQQDVGRPAR